MEDKALLDSVDELESRGQAVHTPFTANISCKDGILTISIVNGATYKGSVRGSVPPPPDFASANCVGGSFSDQPLSELYGITSVMAMQMAAYTYFFFAPQSPKFFIKSNTHFPFGFKMEWWGSWQ